MAPLLYTMRGSPGSAAVLMTAKALNINLQQMELSITECRSVEFGKINPQQVLPTLNDDGFIVWNGHVISQYLVEKYGKDDSLYPKDLQRRTFVDQRLNFDASISLLLVLIEMTLITGKLEEVPTDFVKKVKEIFSVLNGFLKRHQWVAGDSVTIADFCLYISTLALDVVVRLVPKTHPNILAWIEKVRALSYFKDRWLVEFQEQFHPNISRARKVQPFSCFSFFERLKRIFLSDLKSTQSPTLFALLGTPDAAAILMTAKHMGIKLELKHPRSGLWTSKTAKENPLRAVPVLEDGTFIGSHNHIVILYLVRSYGKDDSFYPEDLQKRTIVNQRLNFDCAVLQMWLILIEWSLSVEKLAEVPEPLVRRIQRSYDVLEKLLKGGHQWVAGDSLTIADFILYTSILALSIFVKIDLELYPNLFAWIGRVKALPVVNDEWVTEFPKVLGIA